MKENKYEQLVKTFLKMNFFQEPELELKIIGEVLSDEQDEKRFEKVVKWLSERRPIQYYAGYTYTFGKKLNINKNVMIPGPEMDIFINTAKKYITESTNKIMELCTGSGVVPVMLGMDYEDIQFCASDISQDALEVAQSNVELYQLKNIQLLKGNLFEPFEEAGEYQFDMLISNPPYAKSEGIKDLISQLKDNAPRISLDGGDDGLCFYRKILKELPRFLKKHGYVIFENGEEESEPLQDLLIRNHFSITEVVYDRIQVKRFVVARLEA